MIEPLASTADHPSPPHARSCKTTLGRAVLRRTMPAAGTIRFRGQDITTTSGEELRKLRRHMKLVFQDPYASLNPRKTVLELVGEPLIVHGVAKNSEEARPVVRDLLDRCGLPVDTIDRYAHAFSGGQRERVGITRALALRPDFIVADEPVSALDVSVRAQVVNLLQDLQTELGLTYLFIAHDLSVARHISHRIAILYSGKLVELAPTHALYDPPLQRARQWIVLEGEIPNPVNPPPGRRFQTRCPLVEARCRVETPALKGKLPGHWAACFVR